jgi:tRNA nucleotidyltransferase (CCA-adding enzyme)
LLGKPLKDLDIAVEGDVRWIGKKLAERLRGRFEFHPRFQTGTVFYSDLGQRIDLARTRSERYLSPGALPKVFPVDIERDLARRDFTINALALELGPESFGKLLDPWGGYEDLKKGMVRIIHPKSFEDDPTRIFRGVRFVARFGFRLDPDTERQLIRAVNHQYLSRISGKRVLSELKLILEEPDPVLPLEMLEKYGVFRARFGKNLSAQFFKRFKKLGASRAEPEMLLSYLLSELPDSDLPLTRAERRNRAQLRDFEGRRGAVLAATRASQLYKILHRFTPVVIEILSRVEPPEVSERLKDYQVALARARVSVTGKDLAALGLSSGRIYKRILNELLYARLDGEIKDDLEEERYLRARLESLREKG